MNRYILIRRLRGPAVLLLIGVVALLQRTGLVDHFWHLFWPLLLIMLGVIMLAERAALHAEDGYPPAPYPGMPYQGPPYPGPPYPGSPYPGAPYGGPFAASGPGAPAATPQPGTAIVPSHPNDFSSGSGSGSNGGQL